MSKSPKSLRKRSHGASAAPLAAPSPLPPRRSRSPRRASPSGPPSAPRSPRAARTG